MFICSICSRAIGRYSPRVAVDGVVSPLALQLGLSEEGGSEPDEKTKYLGNGNPF